MFRSVSCPLCAARTLRRKDKWSREYGTIFGTDLYLFHTKPNPRSYRSVDTHERTASLVAAVDHPKWLGQWGATVIDLAQPGIQLALDVQSACSS